MTTRSKNKRPARTSRAGTPGASGVQAVRLARALQALAKGLPNPWDESTDFFRHFTAVMPAKTKLDAESFRAALRIGARYELDFSSADQILAKLAKDAASQGRDGADGFAQLRTVMRATLKDLQLVFARGRGVVRVRVWLFGRTHDGTLVGLRSESTET